jgi:hypothetical protein
MLDEVVMRCNLDPRAVHFSHRLHPTFLLNVVRHECGQVTVGRGDRGVDISNSGNLSKLPSLLWDLKAVLAHETAGVLSQKVSACTWRRIVTCSSTIACNKIPAISRSELVRVPFGFLFPSKPNSASHKAAVGQFLGPWTLC